jgi:hypothetical protein
MTIPHKFEHAASCIGAAMHVPSAIKVLDAKKFRALFAAAPRNTLPNFAMKKD